MPDNSGARPDAPAIVMHLSVPADGELRVIAGELAAKIAEHLGAASPDAQSLGDSVEQLASQVVDGADGRHIHFEFRQGQRELVITARCDDQASEVRHKLPS